MKTAFLNASLDEEIFVSQAPGFVNSSRPNGVYKLFKALYGLKQASRQWHLTLKEFLESISLVRSNADPELLTKNISGNTVVVVVYVDDLLACSNLQSALKAFVQSFTTKFRSKEGGKLTKFL